MDSPASKTHGVDEKVLIDDRENQETRVIVRDDESLSLNSQYHSIDINETHSVVDQEERLSLNSGHDSIDINELQLDLNQRPDWDDDDERDSNSILYWSLCGGSYPRAQVIYLVQVGMCFLIITCCLINLSLQIGNSNLWSILLSSTLGYNLPQPQGIDRAKKFTAKKNPNRSDSPPKSNVF